jgi:hypothetical protein
MKKTRTSFFKISSTGVDTASCAVVHFLKNCRKFLFLTSFNSLITAYWISATSTKWSPFTLIFNLGNRKSYGGDKSGDYGG